MAETSRWNTCRPQPPGGGHEFGDWPLDQIANGFGGDLHARHRHDHSLANEFGHTHPEVGRDVRDAEQAFDRLNPTFGVPADRSDRIGHRDVAQREHALALGSEAVHDSRQNDPARTCGRPARTTESPTPSTPPAATWSGPAMGRSGSAPNYNHQHEQGAAGMAADNHTTIIGNLVEDPEVRFTNNGIAVANLRVAVTQRVQQDGEWRDGDTSFLKVNVWRGQAEHLADSPRQGRPGHGHRAAAPAQLGDPRG